MKRISTIILLLAVQLISAQTCPLCCICPMSYSCAGVDPTCLEDDGEVSVTVTGGVAPFTYVWDDPNASTTSTVTGLIEGTYTVTITDGNGCEETCSVTTVAEPPMTALIDCGSMPGGTSGFCDSCAGDEGTLTAVVTGGNGNYVYNWTNVSGNNNLPVATVSNFFDETVTLEVCDTDGCCATAVLEIVVYDPPQVIIDNTMDPNCGVCNGSVTASTISSFMSNTFTLNPTGATGTTTAGTWTFSGLCAGTYDVVVTDPFPCEGMATFTIADVSAPVIDPIVVTDEICGMTDGDIDITVTGGTTPYTYIWSNGATTEDITGLSAGTYTVTVTDDDDCDIIASVDVGEVVGPMLVVDSVVQDPCSEGSGAIFISTISGTTPYTYLWSNGETTEDITDLTAGTYTLTVTDANGCTVTAEETILLVPVLEAVVTTIVDDECGAGTGSIDITVTGGTTAYTYLWSNSETTEDLTGLSGGIYTVTVTDANGCTDTAEGEVLEPNSIDVVSVVAADLCTECDGSISLSITGGTPGYTFLWSNGATTEDITGLCDGNYNVTITDANNCMLDITYNVQDSISDTNIVYSSSSDPDYCSLCIGDINISVQGGNSPYTYLWSNGATTQDVDMLCGDQNYSVTVTDEYGCEIVETYGVDDLPPFVIESADVVHETCINYCDGEISDFVITGGDSPYSYAWSTGDNVEDIDGLCAGTYTVTVTDDLGCQNTETFTINQGQSGTINYTGIDHGASVDCTGGGNLPQLEDPFVQPLITCDPCCDYEATFDIDVTITYGGVSYYSLSETRNRSCGGMRWDISIVDAFCTGPPPMETWTVDVVYSNIVVTSNCTHNVPSTITSVEDYDYPLFYSSCCN